MSKIDKNLELLIKPMVDCEIYGSSLKNRLKLEELSKGHIVMSFVVDNNSINLYETLHGGAFCYLADVVSSYAIVTVDTKARSGVSLELNMSFLRPAPLGTTIYIQSDVVYIKEPLVTAEITFFTQNKVILAQSRHTKFLQSYPPGKL